MSFLRKPRFLQQKGAGRAIGVRQGWDGGKPLSSLLVCPSPTGNPGNRFTGEVAFLQSDAASGFRRCPVRAAATCQPGCPAITLDRRLLDAVFSLEFLSRHEHVLLVGPAGVGKTFLAQALGYSAVRAGHTVRFCHADYFFRAMTQARVDNSVDRTFRSFLTPDRLILDDLGLHRLTAQQSADLYELIIGRHRVSSFVITSNRSVEERLSLFDDAILGNSALDHLANASFQIVIEGASYRENLSLHRKFLGDKGGG